VTGTLFFVPTASFLDDVTDDADVPKDPAAEPAAAPVVEAVPSPAPASDGSLGIGSLKGKNRHG
jgi:putative iron-dependent peroxidase